MLVKRLRQDFAPLSILLARAIENRLYDETVSLDKYNLFPQLKQLSISTLVVYGEYDIAPHECFIHIAQAIPAARLLSLKGCGHFAYLESPQEMYKAISSFLGN